MATPSSNATATRSRPSNAAPCTTSRPAGPRPWAGTSRSATECGHQQDRLQLVPQPPLPQVPGHRRGAVDGGPGSRVAARRVLPRRLHAPGGARPDRLAEPAGGLRPAVPGRRRDLAADRRRPEAPRGRDRRSWPSCTPGARTSQHHPHVHCVVPGGGLSPDGSRWVACRPGFFLPVRVLSRVFRGKFLALLRAAFEQGKLSFHGKLSRAGRRRASSNAGSPPAPGPSGSCTPSRRSAGRSRC